MPKNPNPYKNCPSFESKHFMLRLVQIEDADDLIICYSDPKAQVLFNIDNFPADCRYKTVEEMLGCIDFWLTEYAGEAYIRFCIVDKSSGKAVGTIEMFGMVGAYKVDPGILRIDIASNYEHTPYLDELLNICSENFYDLFGVSNIVTKAIPQANNRINALTAAGFHPCDFNGRAHYYLRTK